jgi:hypothetical protein
MECSGLLACPAWYVEYMGWSWGCWNGSLKYLSSVDMLTSRWLLFAVGVWVISYLLYNTFKYIMIKCVHMTNTNTKVTKAIIPVAGWGTRRLPITKVIEKCMLPIGNRPLIDYIVQDCVEAGMTDIYFVVSHKESQLEQYYRQNVEQKNI